MPNGITFINDLARHIGQTVTIFTTSGGQSGRGFTGVLISVNCNFVRLVTQLGSAPGCALGNCCDEENNNHRHDRNNDNVLGIEECEEESPVREDRDRNRFDCTGRTLGSIVDIPVNRIAAFVHNSIGSDGWA